MDTNQSSPIQLLHKAYLDVSNEMNHVVHWYYLNRIKKGKKARVIRFSAILLLVLSGLVPLAVSIFEKTPKEWLYVGYILAAIGAGLVLIDKYYGYTSSWIRFVLTGNEIRNLKESFDIAWKGKTFDLKEHEYERIKILFTDLSEAKAAFNNIVKEETAKWAEEFLQNLKDLESKLNSRVADFQNRIDTQVNGNTDLSERSEDKKELLIEKFINLNYKFLTQKYKVDAVYLGRKIKDGVVVSKQAIVFVPSQKAQKESIGNGELIPDEIEIALPNETPFKVQTDVLSGGGPISLASSLSSCDLQATKVIGCSISRQDSSSSGTLGFKCYRGDQPYFVSCFHVVCAPELDRGFYEYTNNDLGIVVSPSISDSEDNIELGHVERGLFGPTIDAAIVKLDKDELVLNKVCELQWRINDHQVLTKMHEEIGYVVRMFGRTSKLVEGTIVSRKACVSINVAVGNGVIQHFFENVIVTSIVPQPGDSGALVFDYNMKAIGIMCAYTGNYSIVIPVVSILQTFDLSFKNS